jgi:hypothetical protein
MPATFLVGALSFQAYLQRTYEHPAMSAILRQAKGVSGRERLRKKALPLPKVLDGSDSGIASSKVGASNGLPPGITNTVGWSGDQLQELLEKIKKHSLDWDNTTGTARNWWTTFEEENKTRIALVVRLAEELQVRKATVTEFFLSYVYSNTDNIQANLSFMDYTRLKKEEEAKKKKAAADRLKGDGKDGPNES